MARRGPGLKDGRTASEEVGRAKASPPLLPLIPIADLFMNAEVGGMPETVQDWLEVASDRARDASALRGQERHLAAIYMLGYAVECTLKAHLVLLNKRPPTGRAGHDLRGMWEEAGFKRNDLSGVRRWFIDQWTTDLRYEKELPGNSDPEELYKAGIHVVGFLQTRLRWNKRRPGRQ